MPTNSRKHQLQQSFIYHVYNRSNARIPIFNRTEDFIHFMNLLEKYSFNFALKIYHWVIMSNHYHILLELKEPKCISKVMAGLSKAYSCYYHLVYGTVGFLWQGRFKSQPVQKEFYLIACARYIERNPVRSGICSEAYEYPYSSARYYCLGDKDSITTQDPCFEAFGINMLSRSDRYRDFLRSFDQEVEKAFATLEHPAGNEVFRRSLVREHGRYTSKRSGRPRKELMHNHLV